MDVQPKRGLRFFHARVLDTMKFDGKSPQLYEVTKVSRGTVYYRAVIKYDDREELSRPDCCSIEQFPKYCKSLYIS